MIEICGPLRLETFAYTLGRSAGRHGWLIIDPRRPGRLYPKDAFVIETSEASSATPELAIASARRWLDRHPEAMEAPACPIC